MIAGEDPGPPDPARAAVRSAGSHVGRRLRGWRAWTGTGRCESRRFTARGASVRCAGTQKGTGIAASPHVTGLRPFCPEGHRAWFRRHAPLAPARACELRVGHRGRLIAMFPKKQASFPAFGGPLHDFTRRRNHKALLDTISRAIHRLRLLACAVAKALGFTLRADPSANLPLARAYRFPVRPSGRSFASHRRLRARFSCWFNPASASLEIAAMLAHRLVPATSVALVSSSRSRWFPEGTCTRPSRVSSWFCFGFPLLDRLPYKTDAVIDPESRKVGNGAPCLWIT